MKRAHSNLLERIRDWSGELAIAAIIGSAGWLHGSIETLREKFADLDKRLARVEYSVLGIVARSTPSPLPPSKNEAPLIANPLVPLPPASRDFLEEGLRGSSQK